MVIQNYQKLIEITSNVIYIVALGVGLKCPLKIHLNTQWGGASSNVRLFKGEGFASIPNKFCGKVGPLTHPGGSDGPAV